MGAHNIAAVSSIVYTLHEQGHGDFGCEYRLDDAVDDHHAEMAVAGQIIMDLQRNGLTIGKTRTPRAPRLAGFRPMRDGIDYDSSEQ